MRERYESIRCKIRLSTGCPKKKFIIEFCHENPRVLGVPQLNMSEGAACVKPGAEATSGKS